MNRSCYILAGLLALSAAAQGPRSPGSPPDRVIKFLPLHDLIEMPVVPAQIEAPPLRSGSDESTYDALSLGAGTDGRLLISSEAVIDLIQSDLGRRELQPLEFVAASAGVFVAGDVKSMAAAERVLVELRRQAARIVQFEARLFEVTGEVQPMAVLLPEQADRPMPGLVEVWRARSTTRVGWPTRMERTERRRYVRDIDVEVAQDSRIGDPIVEQLLEGVQVAAEAHRLVGTEDLLLYAQLYAANGSIEYGVRGTSGETPPLDVPHLASAAGTLAGRVQPGGALAFWCLGDPATGSQFVLTVRASLVPTTQQPGLPDVAILPISALVEGRLLAAGPRLPAGRDEQEVHDDESSVFGLFDSDGIETVVQDVLAAEFPNLDVDTSVLGGSLFVTPVDAAMRASIERVLVALQDAALQGVQLEARTEVEGVAGALVHRLVWSGLRGRRNVAMRLIETTEIYDYDVEIAQKASIANPNVGGVVSGINCEACPLASIDSRFAKARIELFDAAPTRRWGSETKEAASLWSIDVGVGRFLHLGPVPEDGRIDLGQGPSVRLTSGPVATRQVLIVR